MLIITKHSEGNNVVATGNKLQRRHKRESETILSRVCGLPGRDGRDGRDGIQGPYGPPGQKGDPGPSESIETLKKTLESLDAKLTTVIQNQIKSQDEIGIIASGLPNSTTESRVHTVTGGQAKADRSSNRPSGGAVYTRWGRNTCPDDAEKLYHGVVVGAHYQHSGSGANYLCLPLNPQWNRTVAGHQSGSYIYGTEFEIGESNTGFRRHNADGKLQHDHEAQCSVCHTPGRQSHVMIPAQLKCPAGWTLEYIGFLMSAHHKHKRSEYVCVDQDPDIHPGTSSSLDGALFYITEIVCGSLPCPPFAEGFEVTCTVCTK